MFVLDNLARSVLIVMCGDRLKTLYKNIFYAEDNYITKYLADDLSMAMIKLPLTTLYFVSEDKLEEIGNTARYTDVYLDERAENSSYTFLMEVLPHIPVQSINEVGFTNSWLKLYIKRGLYGA